MSWLSDMVTIAGPAGIVSAVATHGLASLSERRSMQRQSRYLALRIAIILEQFAGDCINLVSAIDVGAQLNANPDSLPTSLPQIPPFPDDDLGWRSIDGELAHRVLTVPVERSARQGAINDEWAYGGPNSAPFECARQAAIIGWLAWQIAAAVRQSNALPAYAPTHRFDESLRDRVARDAEAAERMRADFAERVAAKA